MSFSKEPGGPTLFDLRERRRREAEVAAKARERYTSLLHRITKGSKRTSDLLEAVFRTQLDPGETDVELQLTKFAYVTEFLTFLDCNGLCGEEGVFAYFERCMDLGASVKQYFEPPGHTETPEEKAKWDGLGFRPWQANLFAAISRQHLNHQLIMEELGRLAPMGYTWGVAVAKHLDEAKREGRVVLDHSGDVFLSLCFVAATAMRTSCGRMQCDTLGDLDNEFERFFLMACLWLGHPLLLERLHAHTRAGPAPEWSRERYVLTPYFSVAETLRLCVWIATAGQEEILPLVGSKCCNLDGARKLPADPSKAKHNTKYRAGAGEFNGILRRIDDISSRFQAALASQELRRDMTERKAKADADEPDKDHGFLRAVQGMAVPSPPDPEYDVDALHKEIRRVVDAIREDMRGSYLPQSLLTSPQPRT